MNVLNPKDYLDLYWITKEVNIDILKLFDKTKKKDTGLHEFYFANIIADVKQISNFPETLKPYKRNDLYDFFLTLRNRLLKKIKPDQSKP